MNRPTEATDVREAVAADATAFATFMQRAWREAGPDAPGFAGAIAESIAEITTPSIFERSIGGPDRRMFLAWHGEEAVWASPPSAAPTRPPPSCLESWF
jgi:hypothetical protein